MAILDSLLDIKDYPAWAQAAVTIGVTCAAFFYGMRGKWGDPSIAISQTRAEATAVFIEQTTLNREQLRSLEAALLRMEGMAAKMVAVQEDIARMLHEQREHHRESEQEARLVRQLDAQRRRGTD